MPKQYACGTFPYIQRKYVSALFLTLGSLVFAGVSQAQVNLGPVTVGAGLRTSFDSTNPDGGATTNQFMLNDIRLYVNGPVYDKVKFMFNTDYNSATDTMNVLDAVARFEISPGFNIWAGRFLPPSDRANLYGPFYAHEWNVYTDGIQDGYPFVFQGRDNGVAYFGTFAKKLKVSLGGFDGKSATGLPDVIGAARVQVDFWDPEDGYYLNGTYYGDKNILSIGAASQLQNGHTASTLDFLLERKLPGNGGSFSIESEYSNYNRLGGYNAEYSKSQGAYGLGSYLFAKKVGVGQFEILGKYAKAEFTHGPIPSYDQKTTEVNLNYVIKEFNARVQSFYQDITFNRAHPNTWQAGVGLQIQM
ncbi:MAG TPA: hypothetical protein VMU19_09230 [Bryobacteraceae bacterium]|nr:hypothetical protein [Bryobacteraceae bacterium]